MSTTLDTAEYARRQRLAAQIEKDYRQQAMVMMGNRVQPHLILEYAIREEHRIHRLLRKKDE